MEKAADIVIIGEGMIGFSIAYHLALRKAGKILILIPFDGSFQKGEIHPRTHDRIQRVKNPPHFLSSLGRR